MSPSKDTTPSVVSVIITPKERNAGQISLQNLEKAVLGLTTDGIIMLENAVSEQAVDALNNRMVLDAKYLREAPGTQFNYSKKAQNILQHMIPEPEFLLEEIHANKLAIAVCESMMGPSPVLRYHKANTNFPGVSRQPVHSDVHYEHPKACFGLAVNINLVEASPINGSTEVWLGSHVCTSFADQDGMNGIRPHRLDERLAISPPVQPFIPKGSIIIRDMRLWHAGMPNHTESQVRVMLNLCYFAKWYRNPMTVQFPQSAKDRILQLERYGGAPIAAEYVDGEVDYLRLPHRHDFGQDDVLEKFGKMALSTNVVVFTY